MIQQDYQELFVQLGKRDLQRLLQKKLKNNFSSLQKSFIDSAKQFFSQNKLKASIVSQKYIRVPDSLKDYKINGCFDCNFAYFYISIICFLNGSTDIDNLLISHLQNSLLQMQSSIQQSDLQDLQVHLQDRETKLKNETKKTQIFLQENNNLQEKITQLTDQVQLQQKQLDQLQASEAQLKQDKRQLEEKIVSLKTQQPNTQLEASHKQIQEKLLAQIEDLSSQNTKLKININEINIDLQNIKRENDSQKAQNEQMKKIIKDLQSQDVKNQLQQEIVNLTTKIDTIETEKYKLKSQLSIQDQKVQRLEQEAKKYQNQNGQQNVEQLNEQLKQLKQQVQELSQEKQKQQADNNNLIQQNKQLQEQIQKLQSDNQQLKQQQGDVNKYIEQSINAEKQPYIQQIDQLNVQIEQLKKDLEEAKTREIRHIDIDDKNIKNLTYDELLNEYEQVKQDKDFLEQFKLKELLNDNAAKELQIAQLIDKLNDAGIDSQQIQNIQQKVSESINRSITSQESVIDIKKKIQTIVSEDDRLELQQNTGLSSLDALDLEPDEFFQQLKAGKINDEKQLKQRIDNMKQQLKNLI